MPKGLITTNEAIAAEGDPRGASESVLWASSVPAALLPPLRLLHKERRRWPRQRQARHPPRLKALGTRLPTIDITNKVKDE